MDKIKKDINLREAVSRREQKLPPMPADLNNRVMKSIKVQKTTSKQKRLWPWLGAVAASIILLIAFHFTQKPVEEQPVVAEAVEPEHPGTLGFQEEIVEQPAPEPVEVSESPEISEPNKPNMAHKPNRPQAEPLLAQAEPEPQPEEEVPIIPPEKQALADIFLAEEALQVAYELRAQQEAIRAYAASLTGEEPAKAIIAL